MRYNCYTCDNESCETHFAIQSLDDYDNPTCPNCGGETTDTNEIIVDPKIVSRASVIED